MINRSIHRWISLPIAIFMLWIGATGIFLQINQLTESHGRHRPTAPAPPPAAVDVVTTIARALATAHQLAPTLPVRSIQIDMSGPAIKVTLAASQRGATHVDYDAATGTGQLVTEKPSLDHFIMDLHSGGVAGKAGNVIGLLAGVALVLLSITGFIVYLDMWRRRSRAGKAGLFWKR